MRLGAIDVGSNSVHMIVADVGRDGHVEVVDRVKETVRLGRRAFMTGRLMPESMDLAVRALVNFNRILRLRNVAKVRAVATSAVRESKNRASFIRRIRRETGLDVQIISGAEEARLIFLAARHALGLDGGPHLLIDVGGGSVELVLVRDGRPLWMKSVKLGAARLAERYLTDDPPSRAQLKRLERHLNDEIGALLKKARKAGVVRAIGTSGTINTLVAMARAPRGDELERLHGASATAAEISKLTGELVSANSARLSVNALAARFAGVNKHGRQVAKLALKLFDATAPVLALPKSARELLEYAALLHDIGHAIDHDRHNRHSYYLIKNAELFGFDPGEVEVIAQAARGHRKQAPKLDSPEMNGLAPSKRRVARGLAAILRVADALDRSHFSVVKNIEVRYSPGRLIIGVDSNNEKADLELWTGERRTDLLSRLLDRQVTLEH